MSGGSYDDLLSSISGGAGAGGSQPAVSSYNYPSSLSGATSSAYAPQQQPQHSAYSQQSAMAGAQASSDAAQRAAESLQSPPPAHHTPASDSSPPSNPRAGSMSSRSADPRSVSPAAAASAPPLHVGPLPAPAAGIRSFIELGTEESDVEFVQGQLDYHWSKCKEEIMARLVARQRRMEDEQRRLDSFRASYVLHVNALQEEIEKLKEANLKHEREGARHRGQQGNMVAAWSNQHAQVVGVRLVSAAWASWRGQFLEEQTMKRLTSQVARPHYKKRILLQVLSSWRSVARAGKRASDEKYWRNEVQQTTTNLIADYEKNLSELRHQLAQAEDVIRYHHEDQSMMEEKLKQAFIRGVCALNREAVSVFTTPAEVAEANIRSHFSASNAIGQGAFMNAPGSAAAVAGSAAPSSVSASAAAAGSSAQPAVSSVNLPPATNPSASSSPPSMPSAPLPSSFAMGGAPAAGLSSSVPRGGAAGMQQQGQARAAPVGSASVGRAPGHQMPYPAHSHAPPSTAARVHPHPHPHPHAHPLPQQPASQRGGAHSVPQPRQGAPRPYGK